MTERDVQDYRHYAAASSHADQLSDQAHDPMSHRIAAAHHDLARTLAGLLWGSEGANPHRRNRVSHGDQARWHRLQASAGTPRGQAALEAWMRS